MNKDESIKDLIIDNIESNCCGASMLEGEICTECGEHCGTENKESSSFDVMSALGNLVEEAGRLSKTYQFKK